LVLTCGLDDGSNQGLGVKGNTNNGEPNHDGQVAGTAESWQNTILTKTSIENCGDEPGVPEQPKHNQLGSCDRAEVGGEERICRGKRMIRDQTATYKKNPTNETSVPNVVMGCTVAKTVRLATNHKS
jgi:hypothetical protein